MCYSVHWCAASHWQKDTE